MIKGLCRRDTVESEVESIVVVPGVNGDTFEITRSSTLEPHDYLSEELRVSAIETFISTESCSRRSGSRLDMVSLMHGMSTPERHNYHMQPL